MQLKKCSFPYDENFFVTSFLKIFKCTHISVHYNHHVLHYMFTEIIALIISYMYANSLCKTPHRMLHANYVCIKLKENGLF